MKRTMELTARQIKWLDEVCLNGMSNEALIKVAMTYYTNREIAIAKARKELWAELAQIHNLDLNNQKYKIETIECSVQVVEEEPEEGESQ